MDDGAAIANPVNVGVVGAGRIGTSHAELLAHRVPGARLLAIADPRPGAADALASRLGCRAVANPAQLFEDSDIEAVVIAASSEAHTELIVAATAAGKAVFCEKPMGLTIADIDQAIDAARAAGVALQVGFNRRFSADFAAARELVVDGRIGTPQLMRSMTRDPDLANPGGVPPWTIFLQTLIHDFDTLLWLNPGSNASTVYATADALVAPEFKDAGLLDTALVVIKFDNGAIATAEASFSAGYGYDVRGEVFGSVGMATIGDIARTSMRYHSRDGRHADTVRGDVELFRDAYMAEFAEFTDAVRVGREPAVTGRDARRALVLALASVESVKSGRPVPVATIDPS
jgi:myo-inositol 2-dehydrogenase / D-chiro-inositol 1-dehydrogenase